MTGGRSVLPLLTLLLASTLATWWLPGAIAAPPSQAAITAELVVEVHDHERAADELVSAAEQAGGYFASRSDESVRLRVPPTEVETILEEAASFGVVVDRRYRSEDLGLALAETRARLSSREEMLRSFFDVLEEAREDGVVKVEREILGLVQEIERLRGQVRLMEHRVRLATVEVRFLFHERRPPAPDGDSSFPWLNTIDLSDLLADFR